MLEEKAALEIASFPSCSRRQPAIKSGGVYLACPLGQAPAVLHPLLRCLGTAPGTELRSPAPLEGCGWRRKTGKNREIPLLAFTHTHTNIKRDLRGAARFSSPRYEFASVFFSLQSAYQPCIDAHPNSGERSLHLQRDSSDTTNTHSGLTSVIITGILEF